MEFGGGAEILVVAGLEEDGDPSVDVSGKLPQCPWKFFNRSETSGPVHQHPLAPVG